MINRMFEINVAAALALLLAVGTPARAAAQKYALSAIPNPPGVSGPSNPNAVNDRGQTVGWIRTGFDPETDLPFLYDAATGTRVLPGFNANAGGKALSVNHAGQVVGITESGGQGSAFITTGFVWDSVHGTRQIDQIADSTGVTAASLGWTIALAWDINAQGDILIQSSAQGIGLWHMTTVGGVSTLSIQSVPAYYNNGEIGFGTRLNDKGIVLIPQTLAGGAPALWDSGTGVVTGINPLDGFATALNNQGDVVGWTDTTPTVTAWLYTRSGGVTYLGGLGSASTFATGVNDLDQVIGYSSAAGSNTLAVIWQNNMTTYLNNLTDGGHKWLLTMPNAISNPANAKRTAGYIVGLGTYNGVGTAWIATPK